MLQLCGEVDALAEIDGDINETWGSNDVAALGEAATCRGMWPDQHETALFSVICEQTSDPLARLHSSVTLPCPL